MVALGQARQLAASMHELKFHMAWNVARRQPGIQEVLHFRDACRLLECHKLLVMPDELQTLVNSCVGQSTATRFEECRASLASEQLGQTLFATVSETMGPMLTGFVMGMMQVHGRHGGLDEARQVPIVFDLGDANKLEAYSQGLECDVAPLLEAASHAGDHQLFRQVSFLYDMHKMVEKTSKLKLDLAELPPTDKVVNKDKADRVNDISSLLVAASSLDARGLFKPLPGLLRITSLDGSTDGAAMQSEVTRQCKEVINDIVQSWCNDVMKAAEVVSLWCPVALPKQLSDILQEGDPAMEVHRKALLSNQRYAEIGPAVEMLVEASSGPAPPASDVGSRMWGALFFRPDPSHYVRPDPSLDRYVRPDPSLEP